jgi:hypothetical protein
MAASATLLSPLSMEDSDGRDPLDDVLLELEASADEPQRPLTKKERIRDGFFISWLSFASFTYGPLGLLLYHAGPSRRFTQDSGIEPLEPVLPLLTLMFTAQLMVIRVKLSHNTALRDKLEQQNYTGKHRALLALIIFFIMFPAGIIPCYMRIHDGLTCFGRGDGPFIVTMSGATGGYLMLAFMLTRRHALLPIAVVYKRLAAIRDALKSREALPPEWRSTISRSIRWMESPGKLAGIVLVPFLAGTFLAQGLLIAAIATSWFEHDANRGATVQIVIFTSFVTVYALYAFQRILQLNSALDSVLTELELRLIEREDPELRGNWGGFRETRFRVWVFPITLSVLYTGVGLLFSLITTAGHALSRSR